MQAADLVDVGVGGDDQVDALEAEVLEVEEDAGQVCPQVGQMVGCVGLGTGTGNGVGAPVMVGSGM